MAFVPKLTLLTILILTLTVLSRSVSSTSSDGTSNTDPRGFCHEAYGFMPCSTSWIGNLFLILVYGYLMYLGAAISSSGRESLLQIAGTGIIGGSILPTLSLLPDALLVLVSGLSTSVEVAQTQVSVGVGVLAGSTILALTVVWGSCVVVGKCDLQDSVALDKKDTKGYSLTGSGISTDIWTSCVARYMGISAIPFIIAQVPQILSSTSRRRLTVLVALVVSIALLISYCLYQVFQPWMQRRMLSYVVHKHVLFEFLRHLKKRALWRFMTDDGDVNKETIKMLFKTIDKNDDGYLSVGELKAFIVGIRFEEISIDQNEAVNEIIKEFDKSRDSQLDEKEFVDGITKLLNRAVGAGEETKREGAQLLVGDQNEEAGEVNVKSTTLKAVLLLVLGTVIAAAFADPLVSAVINFSNTASIPAFFTSFIALPLATTSRYAVSAIMFASRKKQRTASLTFSVLYDRVIMNNVLCLSVLLALVYIRGLTWDFSAEVLVILVVCLLISGLASFRTTFPLWTSLVAFLLYPFSLAFVYVLVYVLGWS